MNPSIEFHPLLSGSLPGCSPLAPSHRYTRLNWPLCPNSLQACRLTDGGRLPLMPCIGVSRVRDSGWAWDCGTVEGSSSMKAHLACLLVLTRGSLDWCWVKWQWWRATQHGPISFLTCQQKWSFDQSRLIWKSSLTCNSQVIQDPKMNLICMKEEPEI